MQERPAADTQSENQCTIEKFPPDNTLTYDAETLSTCVIKFAVAQAVIRELPFVQRKRQSTSYTASAITQLYYEPVVRYRGMEFAQGRIIAEGQGPLACNQIRYSHITSRLAVKTDMRLDGR